MAKFQSRLVWSMIGVALAVLLIVHMASEGRSVVSGPRASMPISRTLFGGSGERVDVALVLDSSSSMAGPKLAAMQATAIDLVERSLERPGGNIRFAVVPFSQYVNVGVRNHLEPWLAIDVEVNPPLFSCRTTLAVVAQRNCEAVETTELRDGEAVVFTSTQCDTEFGPPELVCQKGPVADAWRGCVGSPAHPADTDVAATAGVRIPGLTSVGCGAEILPLIADEAAIALKIGSLTAGGETYLASGLYWGYRALAGSGYGFGLPDEASAKKIVVIMTDGGNTRSPTYPAHDGDDRSLADRRTLELCSSMKAAGVEIFAVSLSPGGVDALLGECASGPNHLLECDMFQALAEFAPFARRPSDLAFG
jgi:hypothetical protein